MKTKTRFFINDQATAPGPFDPEAEEDLWFLPPEEADDLAAEVFEEPRARRASLIDAAAWRAAEADLAGDLAELTFDLGRLCERVAVSGSGAVQRLALAEAASLSWWSGDRVSSDRLALWLSYRIGASEEGGEGLIRTAWAARRLAATRQGTSIVETLALSLGEGARVDPGLLADVASELEGFTGASPVTQGAALYHLWRALDERPDHLRGIEAAVLGARMCLGQRPGQGASLPFLPLSLTGFGALTSSGPPAARLAGWISGAHRAVLSGLMLLQRVPTWKARAAAETRDLSGRPPG